MRSILWKALVLIFVVSGLVALPAVLRVQRSLPCKGQVMEWTESQGREQNDDGTTGVVTTYLYTIRFQNPVTHAVDSKILADIRQDKGASLDLLYDPSDRSLVLNKPTHLYGSALTCFCTLAVFWTLAAIAVFF